MKKAEIISVGTELLTGSILNTNAKYLAERLTESDYEVTRVVTVADEKEDIKEEFLSSLESDLIILTGGLGPTMDDLTTEAVAESLGLELKLDTEWLDRIKEFFSYRNMPFTENNTKQALIPEGAEKIDNPHGTACGIRIVKKNKNIFLLPGVPREMKEMFEKSVLGKINDETDELDISYYMLTGIGESAAEDLISDIVASGDENRLITTYASPGEIEIRITSNGVNTSDWENTIEERLDKYIYSRTKESLHEAVARYLMEKSLTISTAESLTGGLVGEMLTQISGISSVYKLGIISYSNEAKIVTLGVPEETIDEFGAVSSQTCKAMCEGVREILGTDIGVSTTGVAGPETSEGKPVGLCYIGVATENETRVVERHFSGTRETIRRYAANAVFQLLKEMDYIKKYG